MRLENTPVLETPRLILRRFAEPDIEDIYRIYSDREVNRFLPWFPLRSLDEAREFLFGEIFCEYAKESAYRYAIESRSDRRVVGYVSLCAMDLRSRCGDLGYGLCREYWGRGVMTEAGRAVLQRLRESGFDHVTATHDVRNPASGRVMQKLGMTYRYSYKERWMPKDEMVIFRLYQIDF